MRKEIFTSPLRRLCCAMLTAGLLLSRVLVGAAAAENEQALIQTLKSDAPGGEKAIACKKLAIFGSQQAVPALAPLLADPQLGSWARIALEAMPGPAADEALRAALSNLKGRLLVGAINSIGVRQDAKAVRELSNLLKDPDLEVASAAAVALGHIGGDAAGRSLRQLLTKAPAQLKGPAAQGSILCAEQMLANGKNSQAAALYDAVRKSGAPKQTLLDATRGAILARKAKGTSLLVEQLRSPDKGFFNIGLSTARELEGAKVTQAIAKEMDRAPEDRQPQILLALAGRSDPEVMNTITAAARNGTPKLRLTAVSVLENLGNISSVPLLLECASGENAELSQAAKAALVRLYGTEVDRSIADKLPSSSGRLRRALVEVASKRGIQSSLPEIIKSASTEDSALRGVALQAVGALGGTRESVELVKLLKTTTNSEAQAQIEQALLSISGRSGCVPEVHALINDGSPAVRVVAIHALAAAGGSEALNSLQAATSDRESTVQDEAVRTLSSWPNTWPEDAAIAPVLLKIGKDSGNTTHKVLALRGYTQFIQGDKKLSNPQKVEMISEAIPLMQRAEEKRSAIAVLQKIPADGALKILTDLADQEGVGEDACLGIVDLAGKDRKGLSKEARQAALQVAADKLKDDTGKRKAEQALKSIQ